MWEAEGRHREPQGEGMHRQPQGEVGGGGKAQARGERRSEGICSDREWWEAEGRHRERHGEEGGGGKA